ncbi:hypothetical protein SAMN05216494_1364 [Streptococcus sp. NLAE-zl-C503]|uniref:YobI family P-loop NTPase n=1 Tax=Streptococcus sp. NLAE-zl-C503 TaxID=1855327 RepID=UPI00088C5355|nr:hypothetical protein [Streptococcus sp. NLAE-zl-C503]SDP49160.1 hypothetical protein SAMN05216494_1364 [Streptococcus sp. NLAE-zl-C503]
MEREYKFRSLTSNKDVEIKQVTLEALQFAIDKKSEVTNVAITGNYGAGKSSIVESFERRCTDKTFLYISLGQYDETIGSEKNGLNNRQINTIEGKIINQLLHQINPNQIRKSIFKTLDAESQIKPFNISIYLGLVILLSLYLLNISSWNGLIHNFSWLSWATKPISFLLVLVILFVLIVYGIYYLLKLQKDFGFIKKLSLKAEKIETDIEIFSNDNSKVSYFDRYLDDVLYLFKQSGANVIVFEDIERFNDSRIFEKLKELNIIINRNRKANHKRKLVFFYLVKDDLFESQERTKFFDFIIPIVPVVTASNSNEKLKELLTEMCEYGSLDKTFLFNISLYLDDMRLINNICNEYLTYKETLSKLPLEREKIFSMVVYKNIFPKDFSLLQRNQGYLYELLNSKEITLKNRREELYSKIKELEKKIEKAEEEQLNDELELYGTILKVPLGRKVIKVNGKSESDFSSRSDYIKELLADDSEIITFQDYWDADNNQSKRTEDIDSVFPDKNTPEFQERLENIRNKKLIEKLEKEIKKMNDELGKLDSYRLSDVYQYGTDIDDFKSDFTEEIRKNPQSSIISFLIRNAYIDESYQDYLNHFYENTITVEEKEYLRNVVSGRDGNYDISLTNTNEIVNRLTIKDYRYSYVLNYNLFDYLLNSKKENDNECLAQIFKQENVLDFLINFYNTLDRAISGQGVIYKKETIKLFLKKWLEHNVSLFNEYLEIKNGGYAAPNKNSLILSLMNLVDLSDIPEKTKVLISGYINDNQELLSPNMSYEIQQFTKNLSNIDIKFKEYFYRDDIYDKRILDYTYQNNLYLISENNLKFFIKWNLGKRYTNYEYTHKNFELINKNIELKSLLDYCLDSEDNLLQYTNVYIKISNGKMDDDSSYIEHLLKHDILFRDEGYEVGEVTPAESIFNSIPDFSIKYTIEKFEGLSNDIELIKNLVLLKKGQVNSEIVCSYFSLFGNIAEYLVPFINQDPNFVLNREIFVQLDEEVQEDFFVQVVSADNLALTIYKSMLVAMQRHYEDFDVTGLSDDRLEVLIDLEVIKFNANKLKFIREKYPSMKNYFISRNIEKYLEIEEDVHDETELNDLLQYEEIDDSYKLQIIDILDHVSLKNKQFSLKLVAHILDSKFDMDDLSYIISSNYYDNADESIKIKIRQLAKENWDDLIRLDSEEISIQLCRELLAMDDIETLERKSLLKDNLLSNPEMSTHRLTLLGEYLNLFELWEIMDFLGDSDVYKEWEKAFEKLNRNEKGNNDVIVKKSNFNEKMRNYLLSKGLISSSSIQPLGIRLNGFREDEIRYW